MHILWKWTKQFINRSCSALLIFKQEMNTLQRPAQGCSVKEGERDDNNSLVLWICRNLLHVRMFVVMLCAPPYVENKECGAYQHQKPISSVKHDWRTWGVWSCCTGRFAITEWPMHSKSCVCELQFKRTPCQIVRKPTIEEFPLVNT